MNTVHELLPIRWHFATANSQSHFCLAPALAGSLSTICLYMHICYSDFAFVPFAILDFHSELMVLRMHSNGTHTHTHSHTNWILSLKRHWLHIDLITIFFPRPRLHTQRFACAHSFATHAVSSEDFSRNRLFHVPHSLFSNGSVCVWEHKEEFPHDDWKEYIYICIILLSLAITLPPYHHHRLLTLSPLTHISRLCSPLLHMKGISINVLN